MADNYIHKGHRQRMREQFLQNGLDGFNDVRALEMLLFYSYPKGDTNPIAHALLERFHTLDGVLSASYEQLTALPNVGPYTAVYLKFIYAICGKIRLPSPKDLPQLLDSEDAGKYLVPFYNGEQREVVRVALLNNQKRLIRVEKVNEGIVNASEINLRRIAEMALEAKAAAIILCHNHPGGDTTPSEADCATTAQICKALGAIGIEVCDHIIVSGDKFVSMRRLQLM